ncbi:MAG: glycosyltransferase family 8 protein [Alphaproteobacteria bacterium]|nr:glycosyltransferase family 8 protein [Alphaproteobacteria bacterium]
MGKINVLYTFDSKFWRLAAVAINSLMAHRDTNTEITVYCMVAPFTRGKKKIKQIVTSQGGNLVWRKIRKRENPYRKYDYSRWSPVIFYRLFAHRIFQDIDKILYMDSDTLVQTDMRELFDIDISQYALGAVRDMAPTEDPDSYAGKYVRKFKEQYLKNDLYVNSGVLLINLKKMLEFEQDLTNVKIALRYPDQDIINVALDGKILELPLRYNFIPDRLCSAKFSKDAYIDAVKRPAIYHFYAIKPYIYHLNSRETYAMFANAARAVGMYPDQFRAGLIKRKTTKLKTPIPFVYIDKNNIIRIGPLRIESRHVRFVQ